MSPIWMLCLKNGGFCFPQFTPIYISDAYTPYCSLCLSPHPTQSWLSTQHKCQTFLPQCLLYPIFTHSFIHHSVKKDNNLYSINSLMIYYNMKFRLMDCERLWSGQGPIVHVDPGIAFTTELHNAEWLVSTSLTNLLNRYLYSNIYALIQ